MIHVVTYCLILISFYSLGSWTSDLQQRLALLEDKAARPLHYYYPEYRKLDPKRASLNQWAGVSCAIVDEKELDDIIDEREVP